MYIEGKCLGPFWAILAQKGVIFDPHFGVNFGPFWGRFWARFWVNLTPPTTHRMATPGWPADPPDHPPDPLFGSFWGAFGHPFLTVFTSS